MGNKNLNKAGVVKNDEFYTRIEDIEKEMKHYTKHFKGKVILMPCDDPALMRDLDGLSNDEKSSKFWVFFHKNFERLGLKKIIATHYNKDGKSYKIEYEGGDDNDVLDYVKTDLEGDGDFRSDEIVGIMKSSDVVITNPPFSLFREFLKIIQDSLCSFLILGSINATSYKETFIYIKEKKMWWGINYVTGFVQPDNTIKKVPTTWYTNLQHTGVSDKIILYKKYSPEEYPKYENHDVININKVKDIPMDYDGVMGVPITFLKRYNPFQFEIISLGAGCTNSPNHYVHPVGIINGKMKYARIHIKRKIV